MSGGPPSIRILLVALVFLAAVAMAGAAFGDEADPDLSPDLYQPPAYVPPPAPKKPPATVRAAPLPAKTAAAAPVPAGPPQELFQKGFYQAAYAGFQPLVSAGNPEAAFYALVIRRNGLDGRPPADPAEMAGLWNMLAAEADNMRRDARDRQIPPATRQVYRTAVAQLDYFGPAAPFWPPSAARDAEAEKRARAARRALAGVSKDFTPAMNFMAFLAYDLENPKETFTHTLRAAEAGDFLAMGNLAWLYRDGVGTDKNNLRAAHWARRGCDSTPPVPRNENEVGYCYEAGLGVTPDMMEAANWYARSAARGHPGGRANAARLKNKGGGQAAAGLDNLILF